jgi:hypothetical protein
MKLQSQIQVLFPLQKFNFEVSIFKNVICDFEMRPNILELHKIRTDRGWGVVCGPKVLKMHTMDHHNALSTVLIIVIKVYSFNRIKLAAGNH